MLFEDHAVTDTVVVPRPGYAGDLATIRVSTMESAPKAGRTAVAHLVRVTWPAPRPPRGEDPDATQQRAVLGAMLRNIVTATQTKATTKVENQQLEHARANLERYMAAQEA